MTEQLTKLRERFEQSFHEQDWGWGSEGYSTKLVERIHQPKLLAFIEKEVTAAYLLGRSEVREAIESIPIKSDYILDLEKGMTLEEKHGWNACRLEVLTITQLTEKQ